jgi:hypothetical protein
MATSMNDLEPSSLPSSGRGRAPYYFQMFPYVSILSPHLALKSSITCLTTDENHPVVGTGTTCRNFLELPADSKTIRIHTSETLLNTLRFTSISNLPTYHAWDACSFYTQEAYQLHVLSKIRQNFQELRVHEIENEDSCPA